MSVSPTLVITLEWTLLVLSLLFVCIRLYVRLSKLQSTPLLADYLIVVAWIVCLGTTILAQELHNKGLFAPIRDPNNEVANLKLSFATSLMYDVGLYLPKFSLLAQYFLWISAAFPKLRIALRSITVYVALCCLTTCLLELLWCRPLRSNWALPMNQCHLLGSMTAYVIIWTCNVSSDILIFVLPFFLLQYLRFGRGVYYAAVGVFLLGFITILTTAARFVIVSLFFQNHVGVVFILYGIEFNISIIIVCLPSLKIFFKDYQSASQSSEQSKSILGHPTRQYASVNHELLERQ